MSEEKAQALSEKFRDLKAITDVIETAYECGIRAFMLNTNERARDICNYLRDHAERYPDLNLYPSMPYAHKYANAVTEKGSLAPSKKPSWKAAAPLRLPTCSPREDSPC